MVTDSLAAALESRGLYRRAAERWTEVMMKDCLKDQERMEAMQHRIRCLALTKRIPEAPFSAKALRQAANQAQQRMGIAPRRLSKA